MLWFVLISLAIGLAFWLMFRDRRVYDKPPVQCPYCPNPNRFSVKDDINSCQYKDPYPEQGGDPPCTIDGWACYHRI